MSKLDTYQQVTDAIIAAIEAGVTPWSPEWQNAPLQMPHRVTGEPYRGINVLLLWMAAQARGFGGKTWMTFNQAKELGASVRKGEKSTHIVFFKTLDVTRTDAAGVETADKVPMLRGYSVFNSDQIDGLPARYASPALTLVSSCTRDEASEAALRSSGATIVEGGGGAYYSPAADVVTMPDFERFHSASGYLATLAHELCHWTGHKSRLDRLTGNAHGTADYAREELVAELGAAFIGSRLGFVGEHLESHAGYLSHWVAALRSDKRAIFRAASAAQAAADMVLQHAATATAAKPVAAAAPIETAAPIAAQFAFAMGA
jgi:antirestriction protein ArdC